MYKWQWERKRQKDYEDIQCVIARNIKHIALQLHLMM